MHARPWTCRWCGLTNGEYDLPCCDLFDKRMEWKDRHEPETIYKGERLEGGCRIHFCRPGGSPATLPLMLEIRKHSPTGFEWGYGGSGPAQTALALVASQFPLREALQIYQEYKHRVVSRLAPTWTMNGGAIRIEGERIHRALTTPAMSKGDTT